MAVEADGGQHYDEQGRSYDRQRSEALAGKGIRVLRFSHYEILKYPDAVQGMIYHELTGRSPA